MPDVDGRDSLVAALEEIASEQKVYKGHGDYDIIPALTAEEAMMRARDALDDFFGQRPPPNPRRDNG